jgi:hypothetical protein
MRAGFGVGGGRALRPVRFGVPRCGGFYPKVQRHTPACPRSACRPVPSATSLTPSGLLVLNLRAAPYSTARV